MAVVHSDPKGAHSTLNDTLNVFKSGRLNGPHDPSTLTRRSSHKLAPLKRPISFRHLDEFQGKPHPSLKEPESKDKNDLSVQDENGDQDVAVDKDDKGNKGGKDDKDDKDGKDGKDENNNDPKHKKDMTPLSIKPMMFTTFVADGLHLYWSNLRHPERIPGTDWVSRVYAMGLVPVLILSLAVIQWGIGLLVYTATKTPLGIRCYRLFYNDQIALVDDTGMDPVEAVARECRIRPDPLVLTQYSMYLVWNNLDTMDEEGDEEALRQLVDQETRSTPVFSYHLANLLLIFSSMSYARNEDLVAEASKILLNVTSDEQRLKAEALLSESERAIDERASEEFGMRFAGISELKSLGGPYAGLFYNDEAIVLVFKGTSVLSFNEYLIDATIQRVDASEYLYGEVHKGFYESLFPDAKPSGVYEALTYDRTNPFNTIMQTILETAKAGKEKTGKPVQLWLTGHSLGGALAALFMARLQMIVQKDDPLVFEVGKNRPDQFAMGERTVLDEMLARFSEDAELVVLRDAYTVASPKLGDTDFAKAFGHYQARFCQQSAYKSAYWRMAADMDIVPYMPPSLNVDSEVARKRVLPCAMCLEHPHPPNEGQREEQGKDPFEHGLPMDKRGHDSQQTLCAALNEDTEAVDEAGMSKGKSKEDKKDPSPQIKHDQRGTKTHFHSLLDYQHVGQLIRTCNAAKIPTVRPSSFEANLCSSVLRPLEALWSLQTRLELLSSPENQDQLAKLSDLVPEDAAAEAGASSPSIMTSETDPKSTAQQLARDLAKARTLYGVDELGRLREPSRVERLILALPTLLSHSPATYQRNLIRARFFFSSFPGVAFEKRIKTLDAERVLMTLEENSGAKEDEGVRGLDSEKSEEERDEDVHGKETSDLIETARSRVDHLEE